MIILVTIFILMLISAASIIAAGMLSSRLSRQEQWIETYSVAEPIAREAEPYRYK